MKSFIIFIIIIMMMMMMMKSAPRWVHGGQICEERNQTAN